MPPWRYLFFFLKLKNVFALFSSHYAILQYSISSCSWIFLQLQLSKQEDKQIH